MSKRSRFILFYPICVRYMGCLRHVFMGNVMLLLILSVLIPRIYSLNNGEALTPPMGWLAWERFKCNINCDRDPNNCISEKLFMEMADHLVKDGFREVGYQYINIDDCWMSRHRDKNGHLVADPKRFPNGIKFLAKYMHDRNLKLGIYQDFGLLTCMGYPGIVGHMETDAKTFAEWNVDMVKLDGCHSSPKDMDKGYIQMGNFLNKTGRSMLYSCSWPFYQLISGMEIIIGNSGLNYEQAKVQMAMWAILAAPLLMSNDLRKIPSNFREILLNKEVIAVNQDKLGIQGKRIYMEKKVEIWTRPINPVRSEFYSYAIAFLNINSESVELSITFKEVGLTFYNGYHVKDLFDGKDYGFIQPHDNFKISIKPTAIVMVRAIVISDNFNYL
ncbi:alpha-N-acetylgalactosaminidase-like isoform X2 [Centruroides sculpturatus]|uniref:alpha-N-acetylgalactosaminidase-like isoform X2 n=1 Tax=Centruroides sculpturatus TaxID=218467 RepID=UPI000C6CE297|nr:alpha-N-acetylgalactosaminidase-like isoform X2 [Centruroides sculpturatus]